MHKTAGFANTQHDSLNSSFTHCFYSHKKRKITETRMVFIRLYNYNEFALLWGISLKIAQCSHAFYSYPPAHLILYLYKTFRICIWTLGTLVFIWTHNMHMNIWNRFQFSSSILINFFTKNTSFIVLLNKSFFFFSGQSIWRLFGMFVG